jgi:cyclic pyranopterin phosphate synthase
MKSKKRFYFSLNNVCNVNCEFCAMHSGTDKSTYLDFNRYKEILDKNKDFFELQLEGGEPLLNPDFYLFMEYAKYTKKCNKIIISTNGILLKKHIQRITDFITFSKIPIHIKMSINYSLVSDYEKMNKNIFKYARDMYLATEFIENLKLSFNVRLRHSDKDKWLIEKLKENKIYEISDIYELQKYGKLENNKSYDKPFINQNIDDFYLYSSDGINFAQNLIKRSNHEKTLR